MLGGGVKSAIKRLLGGKLRISAMDSRPLTTWQEGNVSAQCLREWPADSRLTEAWLQLLHDCGYGNALVSPAWQRALTNHFHKPGRMRLTTVHDGAQLLGILPLQLAEGGYLETAGAAVSDYLDPIIRPGHEQAFWRAALSLMSELWDSGVSGLVIHNIRPDWPSRGLLANFAAAQNFTHEEIETEKVVRIRLPGDWDAYCNSIEHEHKKKMLQTLRRADAHTKARLIIPDPEVDPIATLTQAVELAIARGGERGDAIDSVVRPLLMDAGPELMRQRLLVIKILIMEEEPAACILLMPTKIGYLYYNGGINPKFHKWSPGTVVSALSIKQATEENAQAYDMLRGQEEYKYRFGAKDEPLYRITLKPK